MAKRGRPRKVKEPKIEECKSLPFDVWCKLIEKSNSSITGKPNIEQLTEVFSMVQMMTIDCPDHIEYSLMLSGKIKQWCVKFWGSEDGGQDFETLYRSVLRWEANYWFESFLIYMEIDRKPEKRFYMPRRRTLKIVVQDLQDLEDGKIEFLGISMPPRTGKSTLCIFFMAWVIGRHKSSHNAMSGHSGILADRFYRDVMKLATDPEYKFSEIFPDVKLEDKSSDKNEMFFDKKEAFATLTCRGIDGTWTGAVDISSDGYLYVDDMVRDRTESLSQIRLENRYQDYLNVLVDRKNDGSKELMVGTRWNVLDPLGRVESVNDNDPRYRFRKIPALDENDKSNFEYDYGKGFSTEHYINMRKKLDKNEWMAKFQQKPFVREGLILPEESLRTYNGVLPDGDYRVISACDVAWGGGDSLGMPVGYEYENGDVYIASWIFDKHKKEITIPRVVGKIMEENIREICFEANNGGDMYASKVSEKLTEFKYMCSCTSKRAPGNLEKKAKVLACSGYITDHFIFLDREHQDQEYKEAFDEMTMATVEWKELHDDAIDSVSQLAMKLEGSIQRNRVEAVQNPFRGKGYGGY